LAGEGIATRKWDGAACMVRGGRLFARYDAKAGRPPPPDGIPCELAPDAATGHWPHWVPADRPEDKWIREAAGESLAALGSLSDGTYEALGPKIGANAEGLEVHRLAAHGALVVSAPRDFDGLREFLRDFAGEGLVFHHPDGRLAKIRRDDFGFPWGRKGRRR
jgi:hypothetical protein